MRVHWGTVRVQFGYSEIRREEERVQGGYSGDTVRVQWGHSEDTVRVQ